MKKIVIYENSLHISPIMYTSFLNTFLPACGSIIILTNCYAKIKLFMNRNYLCLLKYVNV